ncbi:MAG: hypothetical protein JXJ30_04600 [Halothiobacillaceae bacterium]|nr:hypothetical protein [Halothiobacillaceae bacterium]HER20099.1 hypothetical protein [Chromatiales bacterium]
MDRSALTSERFPHVVDAVFHEERRAREAATALADKAGLSNDQIYVIDPNDPQRTEKLEPESSEIYRTILGSHAGLGVIGAVVGLILAAILMGVGLDFMQASPGWLYAAFAVIGGLIGLVVASLVFVRLDHERVDAENRNASTRGEWIVVVHAHDEDEGHRACDLLKEYSARVNKSA